MSDYNLTIGGTNMGRTFCCSPDDAKCLGIDRSHLMPEDGGIFDYSICSMVVRALRRYNKELKDLVVGDRIRFNFPTYSSLDGISVFVNAPTGGFEFTLESSLGHDLTGEHFVGAVTPAVAPATGCTSEFAAGVVEAPGTFGAAVQADIFDLTRQPKSVMFNVVGGIDLVISAIPADPKAWDSQDIRIFFKVERFALCHPTDATRCDVKTQLV